MNKGQSHESAGTSAKGMLQAQFDPGPSPEPDFDLPGSPHHSLKRQPWERVADWKTLCFLCACPLSKEEETLGKNVASRGFCSDGGHGKWMLVLPSLTRGNAPHEGNQGSKVG